MSKEELIELVLAELANNGNIANTLTFLRSLDRGNEHDALVGAVRSLQGTGHVTFVEAKLTEWQPSEDGQQAVLLGSPEVRVFNAIPQGGIDHTQLLSGLDGPLAKVGWAQCMKQKWVAFDKATSTVTRKVASVTDSVQLHLQEVVQGGQLDAKVTDELKRRQLIVLRAFTVMEVHKGPNFDQERKKLATDITPAMLKSGSWANDEFKEYNFNCLAEAKPLGALHPLLKIRAEFRSILHEMGFSEMPTNRFVESSFWNFDSLFQPQQHPARDSHDTFFCKEPATTLEIPADYLQRVKDMHEKGGFGSIGYRYDWSVDETRKNILRTHTTSISSRMLYELAKQKEFKPTKYFSIDRVFRNETLDATHLAEFHQVEGLVADRNLTLGDLIGTIQLFFNRIGIKQLRFKPAYNPYTEPSMEIFGFSNELNRWIEVGNSGIFRPEMLMPMGLPEDVRVIAWGLSLERPTMIKYGINNIRDLCGPKVRLDIIHNNPIARY